MGRHIMSEYKSLAEYAQELDQKGKTMEVDYPFLECPNCNSSNITTEGNMVLQKCKCKKCPTEWDWEPMSRPTIAIITKGPMLDENQS